MPMPSHWIAAKRAPRCPVPTRPPPHAARFTEGAADREQPQPQPQRATSPDQHPEGLEDTKGTLAFPVSGQEANGESICEPQRPQEVEDEKEGERAGEEEGKEDAARHERYVRWRELFLVLHAHRERSGRKLRKPLHIRAFRWDAVPQGGAEASRPFPAAAGTGRTAACDRCEQHQMCSAGSVWGGNAHGKHGAGDAGGKRGRECSQGSTGAARAEPPRTRESGAAQRVAERVVTVVPFEELAECTVNPPTFSQAPLLSPPLSDTETQAPFQDDGATSQRATRKTGLAAAEQHDTRQWISQTQPAATQQTPERCARCAAFSERAHAAHSPPSQAQRGRRQARALQADHFQHARLALHRSRITHCALFFLSNLHLSFSSLNLIIRCTGFNAPIHLFTVTATTMLAVIKHVHKHSTQHHSQHQNTMKCTRVTQALHPTNRHHHSLVTADLPAAQRPNARETGSGVHRRSGIRGAHFERRHVFAPHRLHRTIQAAEWRSAGAASATFTARPCAGRVHRQHGESEDDERPERANTHAGVCPVRGTPHSRPSASSRGNTHGRARESINEQRGHLRNGHHRQRTLTERALCHQTSTASTPSCATPFLSITIFFFFCFCV